MVWYLWIDSDKQKEKQVVLHSAMLGFDSRKVAMGDSKI